MTMVSRVPDLLQGALQFLGEGGASEQHNEQREREQPSHATLLG